VSDVPEEGAPAWDAAVAPLLRFDLAAFAGLPQVLAADVEAAWGAPARVEEVRLGRYPALRSTFPRPAPGGGLEVFARGGEVLAVETLVPPPVEAMGPLGEPTTILPHELRAEGAYVHEYLYAPRGLVLSVTEPFAQEDAVRLLRCRGVRPMASAAEYGPELYRSLDVAVLY
jgi:hypothetical protein